MIEFTVPGRPKPKQRPRMGKGGNVYTPRETKNYERMVGWYALQAGAKVTDKPIGLEAVFYFRNKRTPDLDNCVKALLDGLEGVVYKNDKQVIEHKYRLEYDLNERVEVRIRILGEASDETLQRVRDIQPVHRG